MSNFINVDKSKNCEGCQASNFANISRIVTMRFKKNKNLHGFVPGRGEGGVLSEGGSVVWPQHFH